MVQTVKTSSWTLFSSSLSKTQNPSNHISYLSTKGSIAATKFHCILLLFLLHSCQKIIGFLCDYARHFKKAAMAVISSSITQIVAQSRSTARHESAQQYTRGHAPNSLASKRSQLILAANRKSTLSLAVNKEATYTQVMAQFNTDQPKYIIQVTSQQHQHPLCLCPASPKNFHACKKNFHACSKRFPRMLQKISTHTSQSKSQSYSTEIFTHPKCNE